MTRTGDGWNCKWDGFCDEQVCDSTSIRGNEKSMSIVGSENEDLTLRTSPGHSVIVVTIGSRTSISFPATLLACLISAKLLFLSQLLLEIPPFG